MSARGGMHGDGAHVHSEPSGRWPRFRKPGVGVVSNEQWVDGPRVLGGSVRRDREL